MSSPFIPLGSSRYAFGTQPHYLDTNRATKFQRELDSLGWFICSSINSTLVENICNLSLKISFFLSASAMILVLMFIHDFTNQRSFSNDYLGALPPPSLLVDLCMEWDVVVVGGEGDIDSYAKFGTL